MGFSVLKIPTKSDVKAAVKQVAAPAIAQGKENAQKAASAFNERLSKTVGGLSPASKSNSGGVDWFAVTTYKDNPLNGISIDVPSLYLSDNFFKWISLTGEDARLSYGYEFLIVENTNQGGILDQISRENARKQGEETQVIDRITLPLNPQSITMNVPAAVNKTVTMRGFMEEHNGAPLRPISISGTTGVQPIMSLDTPRNQSSGFMDVLTKYVFKNTIKAATDVFNEGKKLVSALSSDGPNYENLMTVNRSEWDSKFTSGTGYHFLHSLGRFLDFYLSLKKTTKGKNYRLAFQMHKDKMYHYVTLDNFTFNKAAGSLEYTYTINMTAWKRLANPIGIGTARSTRSRSPANFDSINVVQNAVNQIRRARIIVAKSHGVMQGIRSDIEEAFFNPLRESLLLGKDIVGLAYTVSDFFNRSKDSSLLNGIAAAWRETMDNGAQEPEYVKAGPKDELEFNDYRANSSGAKGGHDSDEKNQEEAEKGKSNMITGNSSDPGKKAEELDKINISGLPISAATQKLIDDETDRVRQLTADDIRVNRNKMSDFVTSISEALGGGNSSYARVNGRQAPKQVFKTLSTQDIELLANLNDILLQTDKLISTLDNGSDIPPAGYYEYYRDFAINNSLSFSSSVSRFYVPFTFGSSLESLAYQYLGNADRWIEIAALNGLKAPYIDEDGFQISLAASASGDSATIHDASSLYIGAVIQVLSDLLPPVKRKVRSIDIVSITETILTFEPIEGQTLTGYKLSDNARIKTFLPNTVNSLKLIAIPSETAVSTQGKIKVGADIEDLNGLARIAKVDLLLDKSGDLVLSSAGDIVTASGLTNILQAAIIKMRTKAGSMVQHPDFGSGVEAGTPSAEIDARTILNQLNAAFSEDPRFTGVVSAKIQKQGVSLSISILLGIKGTDNYLPIEATIPI